MTPEEMRAEVKLLCAEIATLRGAAATMPPERRAEVMVSIARTLEHVARTEQVIADLEQPRLTVKRPTPSLEGVTSAQREAISKKLMGTDANMKAARKAGYPSLRRLAVALGVTASFLSQVRAGDRPMPPDKAAKFKALTGRDWQ